MLAVITIQETARWARATLLESFEYHYSLALFVMVHILDKSSDTYPGGNIDSDGTSVIGTTSSRFPKPEDALFSWPLLWPLAVR